MKTSLDRFALSLHRLAYPNLLLVCAVLLPLVAYAQAAAADPYDVQGLLQTATGGAQSGNWGAAVIAFLMLLVVGIRKFAKLFPTSKLFAWVLTKQGGWAMNIGSGVLVTFAGLFGSGKPITVGTVVNTLIAAAITSFAAAGMLEAKKDALGGAKAAGDEAAAAVPTTSAAVDVIRRGPQP